MPQLVGEVVPRGHLRDQAQPTMHVDDLTLRPWRRSDVPMVVEAYGDPTIRQWHARSMEEDEARDWVDSWADRWRAETGASWAVTRGGKLVGRTGFRHLTLGEGWAEAAYWTLPMARGGDVAARALRVASRWMLTYGGLHRLELNHAAANAASCRVASKVGYVHEGTRRQQALHPDGWHDMHLHALLAEDLPVAPPTLPRPG